MKVRWSDQAGRDLLDIVGYIALDNRSAADRVGDRIEAAGNGLMDFPRRGRPGRMDSTRELVVTGLPYLLIYRVGASEVEILRVLHGARDWPPPAGD